MRGRQAAEWQVIWLDIARQVVEWNVVKGLVLLMQRTFAYFSW